MRILFTGGSGKAGRHVVPYLLGRGHRVLNVDLLPLEYRGVDNLQADITDSGQMFNSMTAGPLREHSPGDLLLTNVIRLCCERGAERFDLGVGDAAYKKVFCDETEPLYDSIVPLSAAGHVAAPLVRSAIALKGAAKRSDFIVRALKLLRSYTSRNASP